MLVLRASPSASTKSNTWVKSILVRANNILSAKDEEGRYKFATEILLRILNDTLAITTGLPNAPSENAKWQAVGECVNYMNTCNIMVLVGGVPHEVNDFAQSDVDTHTIHINSEWANAAHNQKARPLSKTDDIGMREREIQLTMGTIKVLHELIHQYTVPMMRWVMNLKGIQNPTADDLTTPVKLGTKKVEVKVKVEVEMKKKKRTTDGELKENKVKVVKTEIVSRKMGDLGFHFEEMLFGGKRLYYKISDGFQPTDLLFAEKSRIARAMTPTHLDAWLHKFNHEKIGAGSLVDFISPPADQLMLTPLALAKLAAKEAAANPPAASGQATGAASTSVAPKAAASTSVAPKAVKAARRSAGVLDGVTGTGDSSTSSNKSVTSESGTHSDNSEGSQGSTQDSEDQGTYTHLVPGKAYSSEGGTVEGEVEDDVEYEVESDADESDADESDAEIPREYAPANPSRRA